MVGNQLVTIKNTYPVFRLADLDLAVDEVSRYRVSVGVQGYPGFELNSALEKILEFREV